MELPDIDKDEPRFVPRVVTHGMQPFDATVAEKLDVLNQRSDYHWPIIRDSYNAARQGEGRMEALFERQRQTQSYLIVIGSLVGLVSIFCTIYSTFFAHK